MTDAGYSMPRRAPGRRLPLAFFARPTVEVARDLLGRIVCRRTEAGVVLAARIVETEAYRGEEDLACHASRGRTARNAPLYEPAGTLYVYFTYGMHWLLNVVTERRGFPAAVLLRAAEPVAGLELLRTHRPGRRDDELLRGPACLTRALVVDGELNRRRADGPQMWFRTGHPIAPADIVATPRIGVDYAGEWKARPWRFYVRGSRSVSGSRR